MESVLDAQCLNCSFWPRRGRASEKLALASSLQALLAAMFKVSDR